MRRVLNQAAHAAARKKGSYFQALFRRLLPRLGYKSAIWAIAHRLCRVVWKILHEGVRFIEQGIECDPKLCKHRADVGTNTSQARLQRSDHSHKSICGVIFDGVARDTSAVGNGKQRKARSADREPHDYCGRPVL